MGYEYTVPPLSMFAPGSSSDLAEWEEEGWGAGGWGSKLPDSSGGSV